MGFAPFNWFIIAFTLFIGAEQIQENYEKNCQQRKAIIDPVKTSNLKGKVRDHVCTT